MRKLLPAIWRRIPERYRLLGSVCETCATQYYPQRQICPSCRRKGKMVAKEMPHSGKVVSFTQVHAAPAGFEMESPYYLGIIELTNGVRILAQVVDCDSVSIGDSVTMVFRKIFEDEHQGAIAYGYKFKVVKPAKPGKVELAKKPVAKKGK